jgi:hypothetical protein
MARLIKINTLHPQLATITHEPLHAEVPSPKLRIPKPVPETLNPRPWTRAQVYNENFIIRCNLTVCTNAHDKGGYLLSRHPKF